MYVEHKHSRRRSNSAEAACALLTVDSFGLKNRLSNMLILPSRLELSNFYHESFASPSSSVYMAARQFDDSSNCAEISQQTPQTKKAPSACMHEENAKVGEVDCNLRTFKMNRVDHIFFFAWVETTTQGDWHRGSLDFLRIHHQSRVKMMFYSFHFFSVPAMTATCDFLWENSVYLALTGAEKFYTTRKH